MGLSVLIVEDEFVIAEDIRAAINFFGYQLFGIARTYAQAIELLKKDKPGFALVDITLQKDQAGLELGKLFSAELDIPFIYITSHSDTGTLEKVKQTNPLGYLLKPFVREAIHSSIQMALHAYEKRNEQKGGNKIMVLKLGDEKYRVSYSEILFMEADGNYTYIQTLTSRFTERKTIKQLMDEMEDNPFIRVHKSFCVNRYKIRHFNRHKVAVGDYEINVGRAYISELNTLLT